jgi:hypothetical protein
MSKFLGKLVEGGRARTWGDLVAAARSKRTVSFEVEGDRNGVVFNLGPDIFPNSFRMTWTTREEREGAMPFLDGRARSTTPSDFLSRISSLVDLDVVE